MGSVGDQTNGQMNGTGQSLNWSKPHNIIDGQPTTTSKTRHGINLATGKPNRDVPVYTREDVDKVMIAAKKVLKSWAVVPYADR